MKRRIFAVLLCVLTFSLFASLPALANSAPAPFTVSFTQTQQSQGNVALDVVLSNTSADSEQASLIDISLAVTGTCQGFTAKNGSGVTIETGEGTVRLCRTELDESLEIPGEGSVILGTLTMVPGAGNQIEIAGAAGQEPAVSAPLSDENMLAGVTPISYTLITGVTVSGRVEGYNSANAPEAKLYASTDTAHETPLYTAQTGAPQAAGHQTSWIVSFTGVAPGTYDLVVTKAAHLTYTVKSITVGGEALDLTADAFDGKPYQTISMLAGDVDENGFINESDVSLIRLTENINKTADQAAIPLADVNGDGKVNESDVSVDRLAANINKGASHCIYSY